MFGSVKANLIQRTEQQQKNYERKLKTNR